jgi:hypothetical protein
VTSVTSSRNPWAIECREPTYDRPTHIFPGCRCRSLGEEWTYRYLAVAKVWADDERAGLDRVGLDPDEGEEATAAAPGPVKRRGPRPGPAPTASTRPIAGGCAPEVHQAWREAHRDGGARRGKGNASAGVLEPAPAGHFVGAAATRRA